MIDSIVENTGEVNTAAGPLGCGTAVGRRSGPQGLGALYAAGRVADHVGSAPVFRATGIGMAAISLGVPELLAYRVLFVLASLTFAVSWIPLQRFGRVPGQAPR